MDNNSYKPPTARVADFEDTVVPPRNLKRPARVAIVFAVIGMASGVLFAIGPFYFGTPDGTVAQHVGPGVLSFFVIATHGLNFRRLRDADARYSRAKLLTFNLLLFAIFALGFIGEYELGQNFRHSPGTMAAFICLGILPFAVNALYLCLPGAKTRGTGSDNPRAPNAGTL